MLLGLRIRVVNLEHLISRIYIPALGHPDQDCLLRGKNDVTIPLKVRFTPFVVLFMAFALTMSSFVVRATESTETVVEVPKVSAAEKAIDNINQDIIDLSESLKQASGDERDALQLQLFQKMKSCAAALRQQSATSRFLMRS